jgi:ribosomal protein L17
MFQDHEEEMVWLAEKETTARTALSVGDIAAVPQTTKLFKSIENEMTTHWSRCKKIITLGEKLIQQGQSKEDIQRRLAHMQQTWDNLRAVVAALGKWLAEAHEAQQYFQVGRKYKYKWHIEKI